MTFSKKLLVCLAPLLFAIGCVHVHPAGGGYESRGQHLESGPSCKDRCKQRFHECKSHRHRGKGGASKCAHRKNACMSRC